MRRFAIGLAILLALSLMLTAIAASAVPDGFCDDGRVHPECPTTIITTSDSTTTTTTTTTIPETPPCTADVLNDIAVGATSVNGRLAFECLWTPMESSATVGTVTVESSSPISRLAVMVRDSHPGDICVLEESGRVDSAFVAAFDLFYADLPDGFNPPYDPYEGKTYWDLNANWCYPQDGVAGMREDLNGKPLHVLVLFMAKKDTAPVNVVLFPSHEDPPQRSRDATANRFRLGGPMRA